MIELTLEMAETAVRSAQAKARALGTPMTVTVVDEAGRLVLSARGDGTGFFTPDTSRAKAVAAAAFRRVTTELGELAATSVFWRTVPAVLTGQILPTPGGVPLVKGGRVIGGIGCGGGTGEQDHDCAVAGAAALAGEGAAAYESARLRARASHGGEGVGRPRRALESSYVVAEGMMPPDREGQMVVSTVPHPSRSTICCIAPDRNVPGRPGEIGGGRQSPSRRPTSPPRASPPCSSGRISFSSRS